MMIVSDEQLKEAKPRPCDYCGSDSVKLRRNISASGVNMFFWQCQTCERQARKKNIWVSHNVVNYWIGKGKIPSIESIPIQDNYSEDCRCEVCGQPGAELHHWAPQSLAQFFGDDWYQWPADYLCKMHHDMWHEIVTPTMPGRIGRETAQAVIAWRNNGPKS